MNHNNSFQKVWDTDFSLSCQTDSAYIMDAFHFHNVFEIYFAQTSGLRYFVDNRVYPVEVNDLFLFNHLDLHRISVPEGVQYKRVIITFQPDFVRSLSTDNTDLLGCFLDRPADFSHRASLSDEQALAFTSLVEKAQTSFGSDTFGADVQRKLDLVEMLIFVNRLYGNNHPFVSSRPDRKFDKVKPILAHINNNLARPPSLDQLADHFYISKYHLCKIFKEVTGFTVNEYTLLRRIIKASELLRRNLTISQIAERTGFLNNSHFITTFKKLVGVSPKQYAKATLQQDASS